MKKAHESRKSRGLSDKYQRPCRRPPFVASAIEGGARLLADQNTRKLRSPWFRITIRRKSSDVRGRTTGTNRGSVFVMTRNFARGGSESRSGAACSMRTARFDDDTTCFLGLRSPVGEREQVNTHLLQSREPYEGAHLPLLRDGS